MLLAQGKIIVVTGASSGLGRAVAVEAGKRGARVALISRRKEILETLRNSIISNGGMALALPLDIGDPKAVNAAYAKIETTWRKMDVLINAAGTVEPIKRLQNADDDKLVESVRSNILGLYLNSREALKRMLNQTDGGTIINITSGAATHEYIGWSAYCSQKAAVDMFTKTVAQEVEHNLIRIAAISPGPFESKLQETIRKSAEFQFPAKAKFVKLHKSGKMPSAEDVAPTILDISLSDWPELSGRIDDLRSEDFQRLCVQHSISIPKSIRKVTVYSE